MTDRHATPVRPAPHASGLPLDAEGIHALAARSMFQLFSSSSQGMFLVDNSGRIAWVNEGYQRFLPRLGVASIDDFLGRRVEDVIPNTQMRRVLETGQPVLVDLLTNTAGSFVVSRLPLHDDQGMLIGAIGIVLFDQPETTLQPLISKFALLQQDLDDARRQLAAQRSRQLAAPGGERRAKYSFASFVGSSPAAAEVKRQARRAAQSLSPVLLLGETGTGQELLAHAILAASARAQSPFVTVNIASIPDALLEAEFFGVAPGAYTGAERKPRAGKFKLADGGTLFLDEIGDMPLALQAKLLRALQEGEIEPLGSNAIVRFDVRVVAATSRDLLQMVRDGRFREDLFYRLHVLPIHVPPLRERQSDVPALVEVLCEDLALRNDMPPPELDAAALALLSHQEWRGNIRELRNVLEQAAMLSDDARIGTALLQQVLRMSGVEPSPAKPAPTAAPCLALHDDPGLLRPLAEQVAELEARAIRAALAAHGGNKLATARALGLSRATLYDRMGAAGLSEIKTD
jgi:transcriptional regulator with PAS, ATPase and Fis domain